VEVVHLLVAIVEALDVDDALMPSPKPESMAAMTRRVGSRRLTSRFMVVATLAPRAVPCCGSSLPIDHRITDGWLRSRRTRRSSSSSEVGSLDIRRVSSMTRMPRRSQASSSSGVGGLCEAR
jgi:hypothetical protein